MTSVAELLIENMPKPTVEVPVPRIIDRETGKPMILRFRVPPYTELADFIYNACFDKRTGRLLHSPETADAVVAANYLMRDASGKDPLLDERVQTACGNPKNPKAGVKKSEVMGTLFLQYEVTEFVNAIKQASGLVPRGPKPEGAVLRDMNAQVDALIAARGEKSCDDLLEIRAKIRAAIPNAGGAGEEGNTEIDPDEMIIETVKN